MRMAIEISVEVEDPKTLISVAREQYGRTVTALDVDGMTEEEALAVADLTPEEQRIHPRFITPEAAIPNAPAAVLHMIEDALGACGVMIEHSASKPLGDLRDLSPGPERARAGGRPRPLRRSRPGTRSAKGRRRR